MQQFQMLFPGGKAKALTLSYDDGVEQDLHLIELMKQHGVKGTFNLNSSLFAPEGTVYPAGQIHRRMSRAQCREAYDNEYCEVALHGATHSFLQAQPTALAMHEIITDRRQMEEIETAEAKLEVLRRQATEQGQLAAGYEELKRAFSQDGIPHNIVRSIVPLFEATATSIISQMSGGHMSIEMRMEKTLKSNSKKEVTALDVIVNDAATGALPYMSRSGGERVKAALSIILALAELKSSTAGVQLGFLFIDEPPFLDDKGVQAYCDALEAIQKRYSSLKIMAITHDPEMKARFPQAVDVVKTAEGSKVIYS